MKNKVKRVLSILLCLCMLAGLAACGKQEGGAEKGGETENEPGGDTADETEEPVELTYCGTDPSVMPGLQDNDVTRYIEEKLNIKLNIVTMTSDQWAAGMASGDLPDIFQIYSGSGLYIEDFIRGNLILELTDLVEEYGPNIQANVSEVLDFMREFKSDGTGNLYAINPAVTINNPDYVYPATEYGVGFCIRWDYYKELGYPEINNEDDLLNVVKQMQEAHPTTADGKPVYGFSGWNDWGLWAYYVPYAFSYGWMNGEGYLLGPNCELQSMFGEDADVFKRAMKFMNKANRMGLVDPEMFTMKNTDFAGKQANLQLLTVPCNWYNAESNKAQEELGITDTGYYMVPGAFPDVLGEGYRIYGGYDRPTAISAKCEHPEAAMKLLDFLYSYEGSRLLLSGIEGEHWEEIDGKKELTDETIQRRLTDSNFAQETGIGLYGNMVGLQSNSLDEDGEYLSLSYTDRAMTATLSEADKAYAEHYGVEYPAQAFQKLEEEGKVDILYFNQTGLSMMEPLDSDMKMIETQCNAYYPTLVAQLINAESDEEFEKIWEDGVAQLDAMGYNQLYATIQENMAEALELAASIQ